MISNINTHIWGHFWSVFNPLNHEKIIVMFCIIAFYFFFFSVWQRYFLSTLITLGCEYSKSVIRTSFTMQLLVLYLWFDLLFRLYSLVQSPKMVTTSTNTSLLLLQFVILTVTDWRIFKMANIQSHFNSYMLYITKLKLSSHLCLTQWSVCFPYRYVFTRHAECVSIMPYTFLGFVGKTMAWKEFECMKVSVDSICLSLIIWQLLDCMWWALLVCLCTANWSVIEPTFCCASVFKSEEEKKKKK